MTRQVPLVVCGHAGSAGGAILRRRDVTTYWALSTEEAVFAAKHAQPRVVLVREDHAKTLLPALKGSQLPIVVLLADDGEDRRASYLGAGANEAILAKNGARILEVVSELTGLAFASHPRVALEAEVEVRAAGKEDRRLSTTNLSASGACIAGVERSEEGAALELRFVGLDPPITVGAVVVRTFYQDGVPMAGVSFRDARPEDTARLAALVEDEFAKDESASHTVEVPTGPSDEASPEDEVAARGETAVAALKDRLRDIHFDSKRDDMLGGSRRPKPRGKSSALTAEVEQSLSPAERAAVMGEAAPAWAETALNARLRLHVEKNEGGAASKHAVNDALTLCRTLGKGPGDASSVVDATLVRAGLLREIYSESRSRHGAKAKKS